MSYCAHGVACSDIECLYSCSHWNQTGSTTLPDQVIKQYIATMERIFTINLKDFQYTHHSMLDIWTTKEPMADDAQVFAFIHGGYWQEGSKKLATSMVAPMLSNGIRVVMIEYDFATEISLFDVIAEITQAMRFINKKYPRSKLTFGGHSAGAHLLVSAIALLADDNEFEHRLSNVILLSGIYDIRPLVNTYIGNPINLTSEIASIASPLFNVNRITIALNRLNANLLLAVGDCESSAFIEQSRNMYDQLAISANSDIISSTLSPISIANRLQLMLLKDENHFSYIERMELKESELMIRLLNLLLSQ